MKMAVALVLAALSGATQAIAADTGQIPAPLLKVGDSWTLNETVEGSSSSFKRTQFKQTLERIDSDRMFVAVQVVDAPAAPQTRMLNLDWSSNLMVDGEEKPAGRPLSFPLQVGNSWTADWTDPRRLGNQLKVHAHTTYKVVGWEDVNVPAGVFHALKIEARGFADADVVIPSVAQSTALGGAGSATSVSRAQTGGRGVMHRTTIDLIYYAPEMKRAIKTVAEQYNEVGTMTGRTTVELVAFQSGK